MHVYLLTAFLAVALATMSQLARPETRGIEPERTHRPDGQSARIAAAFFAVCAGAVLVGVAALRWRVGVDYWQYELNYWPYSRLDWSELSPVGEPGLRVMAKFAYAVRDDPATMFAIAALVTVGLSVRTIYRHSNMFALSVLLYVLTTAWQGSFNGVRQYLACAILFAGHYLIIERRFGRYVLVVAVASLFHISALVMLLFYWVPQRRLGLGRGFLLLLAAIVAVTAYDVVGGIVDWVKQDEISAGTYFVEEINPLRVAIAFAPFLFYLGFTAKDRLTTSDFFYVNAVFVNGAVLLASLGSAYVARFSIYTSVFVVLAIPRMLNVRDQRFASAAALAFVVFYAFYWYAETSPVSALRNFNWVWERS